MSHPVASDDTRKKKERRKKSSFMNSAKMFFRRESEGDLRGMMKSVSKTDSKSLSEPSIENDTIEHTPPAQDSNTPRISDELDSQQRALLQSTLDMIADANHSFHQKSVNIHQQIFELEEKCRYLMQVKEQLANNEKPECYKRKKTKDVSQMEDLAGCETPIDMRSITSVEEAQKCYEQLLLDCIEHQSVLDQIVVSKQGRLKLLQDELKNMGWTEPTQAVSKPARMYRSVSKRINREEASQSHASGAPSSGDHADPEERTLRTRSRSMSKTVRNGLRRTSRVLTASHSSSAPQKDSFSLSFGLTESEKVISNKDMLAKKNHTISAKGTFTPDDFMTVSVIGQGAFGKVLLVVKRKTGQLMAMKIMKKSYIFEDGEDSLRHVVHELEFMRDLSHHPFIVSFYHAFQTHTEVSIVMEWVGGGSIFDWLVKRDTPFAEEDARFYAAQVLLALQCLHANNIVYRDLKLENILLDEDGYIRLSDFGLSARAKRGERIHSFSGTATYLAPEIINDTGDKGHTHCVDLWCFGVMLFIMLTQEPPFWAEHYPDLFHLIKTTEVPFHFYDHLSKDAVSILKGLLEKNPENRLGCGARGIADVQDHPFFQSIDWKLLLAKKLPVPFKPTIYRGKADDEEEEEKKDEENGKNGNKQFPVDVFKGFSFVWNPNDSEEHFLSESIDVLRPNIVEKRVHRSSKNKVVVNFFLWIKELQGLPGKLVNSNVYVRWKHEAKKYCTVIGADDQNGIFGQTAVVVCNDDRSVQFAGSMDNACIACDYEMLQDRKTLSFESRPVSFVLHEEANKKPIGKATIELSDFSFHKLEKTMIFAFDNSSGSTMVLSILCSWKRFNGDLVDNYEKKHKNIKTLRETTDPELAAASSHPPSSSSIPLSSSLSPASAVHKADSDNVSAESKEETTEEYSTSDDCDE